MLELVVVAVVILVIVVHNCYKISSSA